MQYPAQSEHIKWLLLQKATGSTLVTNMFDHIHWEELCRFHTNNKNNSV